MGNLSNTSLTNITQQDKRRIDITVGISYDSDIRLAKNVIEKVVADEPKRLLEDKYDIFVDSLGDSSVNIGLHVWVRMEDYWEARWRITENIKYVLDENGIEIPFPQVAVTMNREKKQ